MLFLPMTSEVIGSFFQMILNAVVSNRVCVPLTNGINTPQIATTNNRIEVIADTSRRITLVLV